MIIGISGKMQSGKDTVAKIIQYLIMNNKKPFNEFAKLSDGKRATYSHWKTVRFADKLKDIVCMLTGCTREELEDETFKNKLLPLEWIRYGYADGFIKKYVGDGNMGEPIMINKQCDKERYEIELRTNWQTAYKAHLTYREMLQAVGTNLFREQFHNDTWVNATMADYISSTKYSTDFYTGDKTVKFPNWIIPDVRFPNEAKAIKDRGGILIRVEREDERSRFSRNEGDKSKYYHPSEVALDDYESFTHTIENNSTIDDLIHEVQIILLLHGIIK